MKTIKQNYNTIGWPVDMQKDFMEDGTRGYIGTLAITNAMKIAKKISFVKRTLRMYTIPEIGSMDWHDEDSKEFPKKGDAPDFVNTYNKHCVKETEGAKFIKEAEPQNPLYINHDQTYNLETLITNIKEHEGEIIFRKDKFDVFHKEGNPYTEAVVKQLRIKKAIVYGVALEVCNNYAVKGLLKQNIEVYAVVDAMKAIDETKRNGVLNDWKSKGVHIIRTKDLYKVLSEKND